MRLWSFLTLLTVSCGLTGYELENSPADQVPDRDGGRGYELEPINRHDAGTLDPMQPEAGPAADGGQRDAAAHGADASTGEIDAGSGDGGGPTNEPSGMDRPDAASGAGAPAPACAGVACGAHARCADSSGTAQCECEAGFQDEDQDGTCSEDCDEDTCSAHGTCSAASGATVCACSVGWSGGVCDVGDCNVVGCSTHGHCEGSSGNARCKCDYGWGGGDCASADCSGIDCSGHGACTTNSGAAMCACERGWSGARCGTPDCSRIGCLGHGTCSVSSGAAACTCNPGWSGRDCETADCSSLTCSGHGRCDTATGVAQCTCEVAFGGADCDYGLVYALDIPLTSEWNTAADVPYATNTSADTAPFDRIAYRLQLDDDVGWVDMPAFTTRRADIGIPVDQTWDRAIGDINVRSNVATLPQLRGASGSLEFWSNCYDQGLNGAFDYDDDVTAGQTDCYGSLQIHSVTTTLLSINGWSSDSRVTIDVGLGQQSTVQPDWTSAANAGAYQRRRFEVYVRAANSCDGNPCGSGTCVADGSMISCM